MGLRDRVLVPNTSSLQVILAAVAYLTEGQTLLEEQTLDIENDSDIPNRILTNNFQNRRSEFRANVNLSEEQCMRIIVMDLKKETIKPEGCKPLLDAFQYVGMSRCKRIPYNRGAFKIRSN
jgi:hypothetical protein